MWEETWLVTDDKVSEVELEVGRAILLDGKYEDYLKKNPKKISRY